MKINPIKPENPCSGRASNWCFMASFWLWRLPTGQWVLPLILTLPSYIANWLSYFVGLTQHCGLTEATTDFRKNTRSIRLPKFVEFLYWHMNWHTEHHMYAGVPCYNLPLLAEEIKDDMPEPRHSTRGMARNARHVGASEDRACLCVRHTAARDGQDHPASAGG